MCSVSLLVGVARSLRVCVRASPLVLRHLCLYIGVNGIAGLIATCFLRVTHTPRARFAVVMPVSPLPVSAVHLSRTSLRRVGKVDYVGTLFGKTQPPQWKPSTMLLRFVEANGAHAVFVITGEALALFGKCDIGKTYEMLVYGSCCKNTKVPG